MFVVFMNCFADISEAVRWDNKIRFSFSHIARIAANPADDCCGEGEDRRLQSVSGLVLRRFTAYAR